MLRIDHVKPFESVITPDRLRSGDSDFANQLSLQTSDKLLQTTRQYAKWQLIMKKDPAKAGKIARLVLKRHTYITGKAPTNETGRKHFDQLTDQLKSERIYLYKSHQFKDPIFERINIKTSPKNQETDAVTRTRVTKGISKVQNLRSRFNNKDCLEFLAGVLEENGISYYGKKGVADILIARARKEDKKLNAYLTGEGITQLLSSKPITIHVPSDTGKSFEDIWDKIKPHIKKGAILSFSSKHFGHTGIIDQTGDRWTYFNSSGAVGKPRTYKVLAEDLNREIHNWWQRAQRQNIFLDITIGTIDRNLAARFDRSSIMARSRPNLDINLFA